MKNKKFAIAVSLVLTVIMLFGLSVGVLGESGAVVYTSKTGKYTATKISHPTKGSGEVDGIVDYIGNGAVSAMDKGQGDRAQNYAWAAVPFGDCVYVSTNYNSLGLTLNFMDSVLGNDFDPAEMTATLDVMYNGHFFTGEPDGANTGGVLTKINTKTNEVSVLMSGSHDGNSVQLRNACVFKDKLYFCGSINGLPKIVEVDPSQNDKCTIIYEGIDPKDYYAAYLEGICTGIRGLTPFGDYLIVSMVTLEGPQILISSNPSGGQDAFTLIADQETLFNYPAYRFPDSIYGGSIWEMVEFNGSLYVSLCTGTKENMPDENTMQSFAIVRGDMGESFDDWTWTPVIGDKADGARYTFGIDPERTRAGAGVMYVFNDYLYIGEYNDEEIPLERILFKADFEFMRANLEQSVGLYRMDKEENIELVVGDATEMFPEGSLSGIGSGFGRHENQYIWRMEEHDGKLYVGTFDTSSLLHPVAQLTNGDVFTMSINDWTQLFGYIKTFVEIRMNAEGSENDQEGKDLLYLFESFSLEELAKMFKGIDVEAMVKTLGDTRQMKASVTAIVDIIKGVLECSKYTCTATRGFDLYVTEDGINFDTITIDGLGDPYNHGARSFASTEQGLMIGTANPFYAAQIWLLDVDESVEEKWEPATDSFSVTLERFIALIKAFFEALFENLTGLFNII